MTRRGLLGGLMAALGASVTAHAQTAPSGTAGGVQTVLDFTPQEPRALEAVQRGWAGEYGVVGDAYSANGRSLHWQCGLAPVTWARWLLIWNPQGPGSAVRICDGPTVLAEILSDGRMTPMCSGVVVTDLLNAARARGQWQFLVQQMQGNPIVFASSLEIVWGVS